jgi:hypothetical protein
VCFTHASNAAGCTAAATLAAAQAWYAQGPAPSAAAMQEAEAVLLSLQPPRLPHCCLPRKQQLGVGPRCNRALPATPCCTAPALSGFRGLQSRLPVLPAPFFLPWYTCQPANMTCRCRWGHVTRWRRHMGGSHVSAHSRTYTHVPWPPHTCTAAGLSDPSHRASSKRCCSTKGEGNKPPMHACTTAQRWVAQPSHSCHPALVYTACQHQAAQPQQPEGCFQVGYTHTGVQNSTPAKVTTQALQRAEPAPPRQPPFTWGGQCWHSSMYLHLSLPPLPTWQLARHHVTPAWPPAHNVCVAGRAAPAVAAVHLTPRGLTLSAAFPALCNL